MPNGEPDSWKCLWLWAAFAAEVSNEPPVCVVVSPGFMRKLRKDSGNHESPLIARFVNLSYRHGLEVPRSCGVPIAQGAPGSDDTIFFYAKRPPVMIVDEIASEGCSYRAYPCGSIIAVPQHPRVIAHFTDYYAFLSNFFPSKVILDDEIYPTVEHAFQAAKTLDPAERAAIRAAPGPREAKRLGQRVRLRPEWETVKVGFMESLLSEKFLDPQLEHKLISTGSATLIEGNT